MLQANGSESGEFSKEWLSQLNIFGVELLKCVNFMPEKTKVLFKNQDKKKTIDILSKTAKNKGED